MNDFSPEDLEFLNNIANSANDGNIDDDNVNLTDVLKDTLGKELEKKKEDDDTFLDFDKQKQKEDEELEKLMNLGKDLDDNKNTEESKKEEQNANENGATPYEVASYFNDVFKLGYDLEEFKDSDNVTELLLNSIKEEAIQEYLEKNKEQVTYANDFVKELNEYVAKGGDVEHFVKEYKNVASEVDKQIAIIENASKEDLVYAYLTTIGWKQEEAQEHIQELIDSNLIDKEYKKAKNAYLTQLNQYKEQATQEFLKQEQLRIEEEKQRKVLESENQMREIAYILSKTETIFDMPINDEFREELFNFVTQKDEQGMTELDKYLQSSRNRLILSFFAKKGKDLIKSTYTKGNESGKKTTFASLPNSPIETSKKQAGVKKTIDYKALDEL